MPVASDKDGGFVLVNSSWLSKQTVTMLSPDLYEEISTLDFQTDRILREYKGALKLIVQRAPILAKKLAVNSKDLAHLAAKILYNLKTHKSAV